MTVVVHPAAQYRVPGDLCVITSYFNPARYLTRRANYDRFARSLERSGVPLITLEGTFDDATIELRADNVFHVRATDVMWQKERLLNLALRIVPAHVTKVAWIDGDVLFATAAWATNTSRLLESCVVVQPFERAIRLPRGADRFAGDGDEFVSFCARYEDDPTTHLGGNFHVHGHTGFAWAARRDFLDEFGLYDACIAGSGDHMMAHAFAGDWSSKCIDRILGTSNAHRDYFAAWAQRVARAVDGRIGCARGTLLHLWHGEIENRHYADRNTDLVALGYDPRRDIRVGVNGCWEWTSRTAPLRSWARQYFRARREDGDESTGGIVHRSDAHAGV